MAALGQELAALWACDCVREIRPIALGQASSALARVLTAYGSNASDLWKVHGLPREQEYTCKPQVFHTARTLKQNMKKSLSDRVSCLVLPCGDVSPSIPSRMPLAPCSTAMSGWH